MTLTQVKKELENIEQELKNNHMSCFIGAGFSKNAIKVYPNWYELLHKIVQEIYPDLVWTKQNINSSRKIEEIYDEIISEKGILQVPEDYVKYKNQREQLDDYIEKEIGQYANDPNANLDTHIALLELPWEDIITTNWDKLIEKANSKIPFYKQYKTILNAKDIKDQSRKRIIKIHGSIEKEYGFDFSVNHKYIVSTSDFSTYHTEHEDFSNFMRVKILENSFCLLGFSGTDPNFLYWIKLLRKTLTRGGDTKTSNKIYLIDFNSNVSSADENFF